MNVYLPNLRLPSTYQEVEYIQSSWTQYIIIWTSFKTSYKTVIDFQMTQIWWDYIPVWIKYSTTRYWIDAYNSNFMVNGWGQTWVNTISEDTNRHTITIDKGTAIVDWNNYSVSYTNYTFSKWIWVFCYNEYDKSPQYNYKSSNKLYKLDIYDENWTHIYNLVPCYRKSDSVIWLYDLVNNKFYTNSWTGTFSKWSDVTMAELKNAYIGEYTGGLPSIYQKVEYIQSSWTQHIDTLHKHTANTKFEIKFNYQTQSWSWNMICGSRTSYSTSDCMNLYLHNSNYIAYGVWWTYNDNFYSSSINTDYVVSLSKTNITINWSSTSLSTSLTNYSYNDWIFWVNSSNSQVEQKVKMKLYYFKIYEWTTLVRDFVPCYRKSDNAIGLYDLANSAFYTNTGSWTFTKWPDAN